MKHLAIAQHEAFHDAPRERRRCRKRCLPVFQQVRVDRSWHIFWGQEARIVRIDQGNKWRDAIHIRQQRVIVCDVTSTCPAALTFLQKPETHHVLEKAGRAADTSFIGTIGGKRLRCHDRTLEFHPYQRPRASSRIKRHLRTCFTRCASWALRSCSSRTRKEA